ncbi:RusA family crossover junction endodeoxyribonuclease [Nitratidesulfovibrio sp. 1201_IL3209]|uniref:RusA family crossover junction endodeoxyribonuclease n=1 Tax=Nitratidesulfovibrio sp. 1201_IL3209 TaxID=3084053 RepID=UPI002FDA327D
MFGEHRPLPAPPVQPAQPGQRDHIAQPRKMLAETGRGISLYVPIVPVGQMRARHGVANGHARTYKHAKQRRAEETLTAYLARHQPPEPMDGPVMLGVRAYLPIPKSKSQKWKADAQAGRIRPTVKPDLDNLLKHVKDCLTQCRYWSDDKQVVEYLPRTGKYYSAIPRWEIDIVPTGDM